MIPRTDQRRSEIDIWSLPNIPWFLEIDTHSLPEPGMLWYILLLLAELKAPTYCVTSRGIQHSYHQDQRSNAESFTNQYNTNKYNERIQDLMRFGNLPMSLRQKGEDLIQSTELQVTNWSEYSNWSKLIQIEKIHNLS